jgi:hypothetical protein
VLPLDESAAAQEAEQTRSYQIASNDPRVSGGFLFGRKQGHALPFVNPVSTAFCVQALAWWDGRTRASGAVTASSSRGDRPTSTQLGSKCDVI